MSAAPRIRRQLKSRDTSARAQPNTPDRRNPKHYSKSSMAPFYSTLQTEPLTQTSK